MFVYIVETLAFISVRRHVFEPLCHEL